MTVHTSSLDRSFNHLALTGHGIDDDRFISDWNENSLTPGSLDPSLAYTRDLMPTAINLGIQDDIDKGVITPEEGDDRRKRHLKKYRELLAENGKLK